MTEISGLRLAIDIGGTFTDTVLLDNASGKLATTKTPTTTTAPAQGALDGARHVLQLADVGWDQISGMIHGRTLATNALIERRGARVATITTSGIRDILDIGYERRYSQYAINLEKPDLIVPRARALTIGGLIDARGCTLVPLDVGDVARLAVALKADKVEVVAICLMHSYANPVRCRQ